MYYVYVIQSDKDKSTYIGHTGDLYKRLIEHNQGKTRSTKSKIPYRLVYFEEFESKTEAIKKRDKIEKE